MKIIISGGGFVNKGAEAMLRTVQAQLARRLPSVEFFLWWLPEFQAREAVNSGFIPLPLPFSRPQRFSLAGVLNASPFLWSAKEWLRSGGARRPLSLFARDGRMAAACQGFLGRTLGSFAALIDVSGFAYGDDIGVAPFARVGPLVECCRRRSVPVIFLPQAWGPFRKPQVRRELRRLLAGPATWFHPRDRSSCQYLREVLGGSGARTFPTWSATCSRRSTASCGATSAKSRPRS